MTVLADVRSLRPDRPLTMREAYGVAERQAARLLARLGVESWPVPSEVITELPFVQVSIRRLPTTTHGATRWIKPRWVILINAYEPTVRQRFSLAHELKHILDHPFRRNGQVRIDTPTAYEANERLCLYFAACLLMPRPRVKQAWVSGRQDVVALAASFNVSPQAMYVRLIELGLVDRFERHGRIDNEYLRSSPASLLGQAA